MYKLILPIVKYTVNVYTFIRNLNAQKLYEEYKFPWKTVIWWQINYKW